MTNNGRLRVVPSVFTIIVQNGKVLLLRRHNTGYADGWYDLPAGHLEDQEKLEDGAVRELKEEVGLTAAPQDLQLVHVYQNHTNPDIPHYGYIFYVSKWSGEPEIVEKNKIDDLGFFDPAGLPSKTLPYIRAALEKSDLIKTTTSYHKPGSIAS